MSGRTYLSIGDVLTLLRQEFPDVTISKIRFLESQGLVNPERTPSGYRKFYEPDVERLRWVLRQQREHFLPLKVIKGRLEQEGEIGDLPDIEEADDYESWSDDVFDGDHEPALVGQRATPGADEAGESGHTESGGALPGFESAARMADGGNGSDGPRHDAMSSLIAGGSERTPAPARAARTAAGRAPRAESTANAGGDGLRASAAQKGRDAARQTQSHPSQAAETRRTTAAASGSSHPPQEPDTGRHPSSRSMPAGPPPATAARPSANALPGASVTLEEIAASSGLTVAEVGQLESFGLLTPKTVGGVAYYDEDAVSVAQLAAGFAVFGVEARHLRLYKNAADREVGLVEQIVLPLLKQRNPESRQRAHDTVEELARLGQGLRAALVRASLRNQLGG